jgi:hypothetical protein
MVGGFDINNVLSKLPYVERLQQKHKTNAQEQHNFINEEAQKIETEIQETIKETNKTENIEKVKKEKEKKEQKRKKKRVVKKNNENDKKEKDEKISIYGKNLKKKYSEEKHIDYEA